MKEATYGTKPDSPYSGVTLKTARFTSESLSGTPETTESAAIRTDRMSGGQVVTGLNVEGSLDFELANDVFFDDWFEAAMMSAWVPDETQNTTVTLTPNPSNDQEATLTLGAEFPNLEVGGLVTFTPAGRADVVCSVISIDTPDTVFTVATKRGEEAVTGETLDVILPAYLDIGTTQTSFLVGKAYQDVTHLQTTDEHSQTYTGELVAGFSVNATYGEIVTGSYNVNGNGYEQEVPSFAQQVVTDGGTITPAGTSNPLNASIDVPLVTNDGVATTYCTESFSIELDNGLNPQTCIGKAAPTGYTLGTEAISITANIYNSDTSYDALMASKLTQTPVSMTFVMENTEGGYAFSLPAVQLSFPDPSAGGQNQDTMLEAAGVAKVGANGESALRIYKL
jgi:hypothetical protein